jgi:hypothetical protein
MQILAVFNPQLICIYYSILIPKRITDETNKH